MHRAAPSTSAPRHSTSPHRPSTRSQVLAADTRALRLPHLHASALPLPHANDGNSQRRARSLARPPTSRIAVIRYSTSCQRNRSTASTQVSVAPHATRFPSRVPRELLHDTRVYTLVAALLVPHHYASLCIAMHHYASLRITTHRSRAGNSPALHGTPTFHRTSNFAFSRPPLASVLLPPSPQRTVSNRQCRLSIIDRTNVTECPSSSPARTSVPAYRRVPTSHRCVGRLPRVHAHLHVPAPVAHIHAPAAPVHALTAHRHASTAHRHASTAHRRALTTHTVARRPHTLARRSHPSRANRTPPRADRTPIAHRSHPSRASRTPPRTERTPSCAIRTRSCASRTPPRADCTRPRAERTRPRAHRVPSRAAHTRRALTVHRRAPIAPVRANLPSPFVSTSAHNCASHQSSGDTATHLARDIQHAARSRTHSRCSPSPPRSLRPRPSVAPARRSRLATPLQHGQPVPSCHVAPCHCALSSRVLAFSGGEMIPI
eukprot:TRINITY_DN151_c0_g1_i16.p1 TRINITY_DN151_c0_g1~~TRINITY_DN151_c0_g1_i16.p1  ORF type:complete len:490 (+),score=-98.53 TRINITY_DN151_c0_g1_i16:3473-4942(+)